MCLDVSAFLYNEVWNLFKFLSLFTSNEAIEAINHIRAKFGQVATLLYLFHHSGVTKHLRLEDFQQAQSQATVMVGLYSAMYVINYIIELFYTILRCI